MTWRRMQFAEFLRPNLRPYTLGAEEDANLVGMRLYGQGPFHRELKPALRIAKKSHFQIRKGDVIYNKLFAWKGTFGIVPSSLDGMFVSDKFPTYELDRKVVDENYLRWYCRYPPLWEEARLMSTGSAALSKLTLNPPKFPLLTMPAPSLSEQQRIVARIEEHAAMLSEATDLRVQATEEATRLLVAMAHRLDLDDSAKRAASWRRVQLGECLRLVDDSVSVVADRSYPNLGIYSFGRGLFHKSPIDGAATSAKTLRRVRAGNFIYSRLFAFEGAYGLVSAPFDGHYVSNEYPTFECDPGLLRVEFLTAYLKAPSAWRAVAVGSKGLGHRRQRVQPDQLLRHVIWLPPTSWQEHLADVWAQVEEMRRDQEEASIELDALLPAILDRAFKGELC